MIISSFIISIASFQMETQTNTNTTNIACQLLWVACLLKKVLRPNNVPTYCDFAPGPSDFECRTAPCSSDQNLRIAPSIAPDQSPTTDQYLHENIADFWEVSRKWISHLGKLFCDRFLDLKFERGSDMGLLICRFLNAINYVLIYHDVWHRSRIRQQ